MKDVKCKVNIPDAYWNDNYVLVLEKWVVGRGWGGGATYPQFRRFCFCVAPVPEMKVKERVLDVCGDVLKPDVKPLGHYCNNICTNHVHKASVAGLSRLLWGGGTDEAFYYWSNILKEEPRVWQHFIVFLLV